jgi:hypothetical protein
VSDSLESALAGIKDCFSGGGYEFPTRFLSILNKPMVYVFLRGGKALYVGFSGKGIDRPANPWHDQREVIATATRLCIYPCVSEEAARKVEATLILLLKPKHNIQSKMGGQIVSGMLGITPEGYRLTYRGDILNTTSETP